MIVSSSTGSDSNSGLTEATPKRTLRAGFDALRNGYPDHLRLRKGDSWTNEKFGNEYNGWDKAGRSGSEPMVVWWEAASPAERDAVLAIPFFCQRLTQADLSEAQAAAEPGRILREAMLELLFASGSDILLLPIQDVFGWRDRINQPATVNDGNWTWRLPWPSDRLVTEPDAMAMASQLREWSRVHGRLAGDV